MCGQLRVSQMGVLGQLLCQQIFSALRSQSRLRPAFKHPGLERRTVGGAHLGGGILLRSKARQSSWIESRDAKTLNPTGCLFRISNEKLRALVKGQLGEQPETSWVLGLLDKALHWPCLPLPGCRGFRPAFLHSVPPR